MLLRYFRQTRAGRLSDSIPCVQRFHSEEILSEGTKILSGTPKFECGVSTRPTKVLIRVLTIKSLAINYLPPESRGLNSLLSDDALNFNMQIVYRIVH